jgi:hypothetical protein
MRALSRPLVRASLVALAALAAFGAPVEAGAPVSVKPPPYGRWTVDEARPIFTARGRLYKTVDIAPCGRRFCGVSVGDDGKCGALLFRLSMPAADWSDGLYGRSKWGNGQQDFGIYDGTEVQSKHFTRIELSVGNEIDFNSRSGSMPKFQAAYRRLGAARCVAK